ncbi:MAG: hypothetical protein ACF8SC_01150 [Phycisphaerales bacterium JB037]
MIGELMRKRRALGVSGLAAVLVTCAGAPAAFGQDGNMDDWEWEADEGYHEQEWYDPSDWFDAKDGVDYEGEWTDYDTAYDMDSYDYYDSYFESYYDGYYDGYYDDLYGYDYGYPITNIDDSGDGYAAGYYDGYYDQTLDYAYDPYYYIIVDAQSDRDRRSDRERRSDRKRERGDRSRAMSDGGSDGEATQRAAERHRKTMKMRGTVEEITFLEGTKTGDDSPLIAKIRTEEGRTAVVNLGPKMSKSNMPMEAGDRVTLRGRKVKNNDRSVLVVHSVTADGKTAQIASRGDRETDRPTVMVSGEVDGISRVDLGGDRYTVVRLNMANGKSHRVAFDSKKWKSMKNFGLDEVDRVTVRGTRRSIGERSVIIPMSMRVNGERLELSSR